MLTHNFLIGKKFNQPDISNHFQEIATLLNGQFQKTVGFINYTRTTRGECDFIAVSFLGIDQDSIACDFFYLINHHGNIDYYSIAKDRSPKSSRTFLSESWNEYVLPIFIKEGLKFKIRNV